MTIGKKILFSCVYGIVLFFVYQQPVFSQTLLITEVLVDGSDEWIEITNIEAIPFSGSLLLTGAKSSSLSFPSFSLSAGASILLGDQCTMISDPMLCLTGQGLSLIDTNAVNLTLITQPTGGVPFTHHVYIPQPLVNTSNDTKTSFHCFLPDCATFLPVQDSETVGTLAGRKGNPGIVFSPPLEIGTTGETIPETYLPMQSPPLFTFLVSGGTLITTIPFSSSVCEQPCFLAFSGAVLTGYTLTSLSGQIVTLMDELTGNGQQEKSFSYSLFDSGQHILATGDQTLLFSFGSPLSSNMLTGLQMDQEITGMIISGTGEVQQSGPENTNLPPIPSQTNKPMCSITEMHPTKDTNPEYFELLFSSSYSGPLTFQGAGQGGTTKIILLSVITGQRIIIAKEFIPGVDAQYVLPTLSLTDGGESLVIYGQSGQEIDTLVYSGAKKGFSLYNGSTLSGIRFFTKIGQPSPGFSEILLPGFAPENTISTLPNCSIQLQHTKPVYAHNKINLTAMYSGKSLTNASNYICLWTTSGQTLSGCNPGFVDFGSPNIYPLALRIFDSTHLLCETSMTLNLPELPKQESCRAEYYSGLYTKRKEQYTVLAQAVRGIGFRIEGTGEHIMIVEKNTPSLQSTGTILSGYITITRLLPNPLGEDNHHERIEVENKTGMIVSGSLYIFNGTRRIPFPPVSLFPNTTQGFTGNWGLLNKSACITVGSSGTQYDTYCYSTPKEGQIPPKTTTTSSLDMIPLPGLLLKIRGEEVCAMLKKQTILCLPLPYTKAEIKKRKSATKKNTALEKKLTTALKRHDKYSVLRAQFTAYKKTQSKKLNITKQSLSFTKDAYYLLTDQLKTTWPLTYNDPQIITLIRLYALLNESETPLLYGIPLEDITTAQALVLGKSPPDQQTIPPLIHYLRTQWLQWNTTTTTGNFLPP